MSIRRASGRRPRSPSVLAGVLLLVLTGCTAPGAGGARPAYDALVRDLERGRSDAWDRLDDAFLTLPDFTDRLQRLAVLHGRVTDDRDRQGGDLERLADDMLGLYFGDLRAHELRHRLALAAGESEQAAFHRRAADALAAAIEDSGDGSAGTPYEVLSAAQAYAWLEARRTEVVGALYDADDEAQRLLLVTKVRNGEGEALEERRFDLSASFRARVALAGTDGEPPRPSDLVATRAELGDPAAQTAYAIRLWQRGPDYAAPAIRWLQAASEAGNLIAREMLGVIYGSLAGAREGEEAEELLDAAVDQFLLAVGQGSSTAMYNLAQLYLSGHFGEENQPAGVALLRQAADRDNLDATVMLARLQYNGQFVPQDVPAALDRLVEASEQGHPEAQLFYARHLLDTNDGAGFDERALGWLREAASAGTLPPAMLLLATLHAEGEHAPRDPEAARRWFRRAAETSPDPELVNSVAWILTVAEDRALRDEAAGLRIITGLMERDEAAARNPAYLDTWAAAHAANGDFERAVALQEQAIAIAEDVPEGEALPDYLPILRRHLERFRGGGTVTEAVP